jgi:threonine dehydratase
VIAAKSEDVPIAVTRDDLLAAANRLAGHVRRTPVLWVEGSALGLEVPVLLKLECLQVTGSFKVRGALNFTLARTRRPEKVIAASGGNHGVAVAYAARMIGCQAEIFVPQVASPAKVERIRTYGATVTVVGRDYAEAYEASLARASATGALAVHAYDQAEVVAGQGTVAMELEEQAPDLDVVLVPVGGGGLVAGIAAWYQGRIRVVAVEPDSCPTLAMALAKGGPVEVPVGGIAADSMGARRLGALPYAIIRKYNVKSLLVPDNVLRQAQRQLWNAARIVAEPGGAAALAALLSGLYSPQSGEKIGVIISGANTDPATVTT